MRLREAPRSREMASLSRARRASSAATASAEPRGRLGPDSLGGLLGPPGRVPRGARGRRDVAQSGLGLEECAAHGLEERRIEGGLVARHDAQEAENGRFQGPERRLRGKDGAHEPARVLEHLPRPLVRRRRPAAGRNRLGGARLEP